MSLVLAAPQHADNGSVKREPPVAAEIMALLLRDRHKERGCWVSHISKLEAELKQLRKEALNAALANQVQLVLAPHVEHPRSATGTEPVPPEA